jgi:CheY-like chemotaxis protein
MAHKLLLADDSVTIQRVIELTFADEDVQVVAVGDGRQAIERVQSERPDIVLADVGMPERDGYEVASFIKGNPQLAHIPVLLLTGAFEPIDEARARAVGCDGVLVKPFEPQMVISRVKDLLAGRHPAGLWTANPPAHTPVRAPAPPAADGGSPPTPAKPSADSLEDYFDRLDAAFSTPGSPVPAGAPARPTPPPPASAPPATFHDIAATPPPSVHDDLANWDPDLTGDPLRSAGSSPQPFAEAVPVTSQGWGGARPDTAPPVAREPQPVPPAPPIPPAPQPQAAAAPPPPVVVPPAPPAVPPLADAFAALLAAEQGQAIAPSAFAAQSLPDDAIEEVVRRVIDRMSDQTIRHTVLDVAERLVREEIERIKQKK